MDNMNSELAVLYRSSILLETATMKNYVRKETSTFKISYHNAGGLFHRLDGPAMEYHNGDKVWYVNGRLHREDGPAREYVHGSKQWWFNDKPHRLDGPAFEFHNGDKEWWVNGRRISCETQEEFEQLMKLKSFW